MSKTIDLQIEKCRTLIEGLRRNINEVADKGISGDGLNVMEQNINQLVEASRECDAMRSELSGKVKRMNAILKQLKEDFVDTKRKIKGNYPQEQWVKYGVQDKR